MIINALEHINLVHHVAKRYNRMSDYEDLVQEGMLGLVKAAKRFDPATGNKFSSYAVTCIRGEILHYIRDKRDFVRCPRAEIPITLLSLNCIVNGPGAPDFMGCIPSPEEVCDPASELIQEFMKTLSARDQSIFKMRFKGATIKSIAKELKAATMTVTRRLEKLTDMAREYSCSVN